jgi:hypothetical protein
MADMTVALSGTKKSQAAAAAFSNQSTPTWLIEMQLKRSIG